MNLIDLAMAKALAGGSGGATNNAVQFAAFGVDEGGNGTQKGGMPTRDGNEGDPTYSWIIPPTDHTTNWIPLFVGDGIFLPFQLQDGAAVYQMFTGDGLTFLEFGFGNDGTITFYGPTYYPLNAEENAPIDPGTQFS